MDSFPLSVELRFEAPEAAAGHKIVVDKEAVLGRSPDCDVHIQDRRVSRRHAKLFCLNRSWVIEDLDSPNGTTINGRRVHRHTLIHGDLLGVGACQIRVCFPGHKKNEAPESVIKPVDVLAASPNLHTLNREAFFQALGLGGDTVLDIRSPEKLLEQTRHFAVLHEVSCTLTRAYTPRNMLAELLDIVLNVSDGDRAFVTLSDRDAELPDKDVAPETRFRVDMYRTRGRTQHRDSPTLSKNSGQPCIVGSMCSSQSQSRG